MLRSKRLEVVLALEQRRENEVLEQMNAAREAFQQQQQRLEELRQYQEDYRSQMRNSQRGVVPVSRLQGWQAFISQLGQVIGQQEQQLVRAAEVLEKRRQAWLEAHERRQGMERHIDACRQQELREQGVQEQKELDEAAGRAHARRRVR